MTASTEAELRERVGPSAGQDVSWQPFHVVEDQIAALAEDVARVRSHPLIPDTVRVGGFLYDVDTGCSTARSSRGACGRCSRRRRASLAQCPELQRPSRSGTRPSAQARRVVGDAGSSVSVPAAARTSSTWPWLDDQHSRTV